jgi:hypothetical protein
MVYTGKMLSSRLLNSVFTLIYFESSEMFRVKEESSSISSLKDEFTQRIAEAEKKVQLACKERDAAKKVIEIKRC